MIEIATGSVRFEKFYVRFEKLMYVLRNILYVSSITDREQAEHTTLEKGSEEMPCQRLPLQEEVFLPRKIPLRTEAPGTDQEKVNIFDLFQISDYFHKNVQYFSQNVQQFLKTYK